MAVLGTRYPDLSIEQAVLGPAGVALVREDGADAASVRTAGRADVVIAGARARFDREVLAAMNARAIVRAGIGVDTIDLVAASELGITVCNVPDYGTEAVAQHALAMALAGTRRLIEADRLVRTGGWGLDDLRPLHLPSSLTAAVVGLGRIGSRVAQLFDAVGFGEVVGHDPHVSETVVPNIAFDDLIRGADVISLHAPGAADALLGAGEFARMRDGAVLVNTARGALIDHAALASGLRSLRPRIACLDVFDPEPPELALFEGVEDRVVLSPHQAWYTEESQTDLRRKSAEEALRILEGLAPAHAVNGPEVPR